MVLARHNITALIEAAYNSLAASLAGAVAGCDTCDYAGQVRARARAYQAWALAHASDYALTLGALPPTPIYVQPPDGLQAELDARERSRGRGVPTQGLHVGVVIWSRIRGLVSLELQGYIQPLIGDPEVLFEAELHELLERMGFSSGCSSR